MTQALITEVIYFHSKSPHPNFYTENEARKLYDEAVKQYSGDSTPIRIVLANEDQATIKTFKNF